MKEIRWSPSQKDAIFTKYLDNGKSCNILVSAAAGSGKTAVLVQRIIEKLIPQNSTKSIDANRLLVVTFTNAAAHEMAERIKKSLGLALIAAKNDGDAERCQLIKRQQLLIPDSDITTIDAFCLRLIRRHFNVLGISPDFNICDDAQAELLAEDAMDELFSELYKENDKEFTDLLRMYASNSNDSGLQKLIKQIYDFLIKIPNPFGWLNEKTEELNLQNGIDRTLWYQNGISLSEAKLDYAFSLTEDALAYIFGDRHINVLVAANPPEKENAVFDRWKSYYKLFYTYYTELKIIKDAPQEKQAALLSDFKRPQFSRNSALSDEETDFLKEINESIKAEVAFAQNFLTLDKERFSRLSREALYPTVSALGRIAKRFYDKLYEKKLSKNMLEFTDVEQLTHKLLSENPEISQQLMSQYEEVLMDEYQDTSLLQEAIFSFITDGSNLFTVGDMKQSIYRFRSSDPTIFKSRLDRSSFDKDSSDRKIILSENFRSRREVLESVNDIFKAIMSENAGEIDYDDTQRLNTGNDGYLDTGFDFRSECVIINSEQYEEDEDDDEYEDLSAVTMEARFIASEIARLKAEHFKVRDGDGLRDIKNRDIVILMSSYKSAADIFKSELNAFGIDCFAEQSGYFERTEIRLMLSLFKVIGNPCSDIPLLSVLRSPIASFTDDELVTIRKCKNGRFFYALKELIRLKSEGQITNSDDTKTAEKAERFLENFNRWRSYSRYMPSDKLVWTLFEETDFYAFCGALYGGDEAQANLRLLFERAKQYESYGFRGIFGFIKYIERIKKKKQDLSSAKIIGENHDVVRIMTIHKSKGLEFPVVFVAGGGKKLIKKLENSRFIMHKDYGITLDYVDFENSRTVVSPLKEFFRSVIFTEQISEDIRKLYVAMTRAKEKLYFVATAKKPTLKETAEGKLPFGYVLSAKSFCDWVLPVAKSSGNWILKNLSADSIKPCTETKIEEDTENIPESINIYDVLEYKYPYSDATVLPAKVSVSQLKASERTAIIPKPAFLSESKISGAGYGTAVHAILEGLIPCENMDSAYIKSEILRLVSDNKLASEDAKLINPNRILAFYRSDIGRRIIKSPKVCREQAFEILAPVSLIYPDTTEDTDEKIILQGIIDCWFAEGDEIVLLDYKTDSFSDVSEIHQKYDRQLELYAYALENITGKKVKEKYIYLFYDGSILPC
ncbi:MAG: helicase-exonuclease AddAB subunit AddA [Clostridia bacterium]|nr:helicase-exonuclease AddAB subunit AddA [Clostridia bacterium]